MRDKFILLSTEQIETISNQFINELHKIPLYDTDTKHKLFSEYIKKIEMMIIEKMQNISNKIPDCDTKKLFALMLADRMSINK
jgi:hypothetical protein